MKRSLIIGIMGGGNATSDDLDRARRLGCLIAQNGWYLLNGGRDAGIMAASAQGAAEQGGLTIGILPGNSARQASPHITVPIITGLGNARNGINVLTSDVIVACPGGPGTLSEIALALKNVKPLITMGFSLKEIPGIHLDTSDLHAADTPEAVIEIIKRLLTTGRVLLC
jgi:hypothetical protein